MRVGIYTNHDRNEPPARMLETGIRQALNATTHVTYDRAPNSRRLSADDLRLLYGTLGVCVPAMRDRVPYIITDYGYVKPRERKWDEVLGYYRMTWRARQFAEIEDRPPDRWRALGVELEPWTDGDGYIAVSGISHYEMTYLGHANQEVWMEEHLRKILEVTKKPVVYRPKPWGKSNERHRRRGRRLAQSLGVRFCDPSSDFGKFLDGAALFYSHTSNGAVEALIRGIPVVSTGSCITSPLSTPLERLDDPPLPDREPWAWSLAYQQYNYHEISSGAFWERFKPLWNDAKSSSGTTATSPNPTPSVNTR